MKNSTTTIAKACTTKYFFEYMCEDLTSTYWQLVRSKDAAILAAYEDLETLKAHCFDMGISKDEVSIW